MPEELCQVSPKSHYVSLALHSDPSPYKTRSFAISADFWCFSFLSFRFLSCFLLSSHQIFGNFNCMYFSQLIACVKLHFVFSAPLLCHLSRLADYLYFKFVEFSQLHVMFSIFSVSFPCDLRRLLVFSIFFFSPVNCTIDNCQVFYFLNFFPLSSHQIICILLAFPVPLICRGCHGYTRVNFFWPV